MTKQISQLDGVLELAGRHFAFYLEHRQIDLGPAGNVQFFYMPPSHLRWNATRNGVSNVRSCIDYFARLTGVDDNNSDWDTQRDYVLASSYELIHRDKAVQNIYRDAFLRPRSFRPEKLVLSDDIEYRIKKAVSCQSKAAIREEMERALEAAHLSREDQAASALAMNEWLNAGVAHYRRAAHDGLQLWLSEVNEWYSRYRKRSDPRIQALLRVFAYEAKIAFYHKYANFWIALIPWLEAHHELDPISRRFLGIWHNQNQRVEIPHGRTQSGIMYPVSAGRRVRLLNGGHQDITLSWKTPHAGPEVIPDVFLGQVLALHPLSWILLDRRELCDAVGDCIASPRFDGAMGSGQIAGFTEYWEMVAAVLTAAYLYQVAHAELESKRKSKPTGGPNAAQVVQSTMTEFPLHLILRDYVDSTRTKCPCGGTYIYIGRELPAAEAETLLVPTVCNECRLPGRLETTQHKLEDFWHLTHRPIRS
jgi:hypothetical protein